MANVVQCAPDDGDADVIFFGVKRGPYATADDLKSMLARHKGGQCDPPDGQEHNCIALGGWIGNQGIPLKLIGLIAALGLWTLLTPKTVLGDMISPEMAQELDGYGMVAMQVRSWQNPPTQRCVGAF